MQPLGNLRRPLDRERQRGRGHFVVTAEADEIDRDSRAALGVNGHLRPAVGEKGGVIDGVRADAEDVRPRIAHAAPRADGRRRRLGAVQRRERHVAAHARERLLVIAPAKDLARVQGHVRVAVTGRAFVANGVGPIQRQRVMRVVAERAVK